MHLLGATDVQIARLFQRRIALDALFGGLIGLVCGRARAAADRAADGRARLRTARHRGAAGGIAGCCWRCCRWRATLLAMLDGAAAPCSRALQAARCDRPPARRSLLLALGCSASPGSRSACPARRRRRWMTDAIVVRHRRAGPGAARARPARRRPRAADARLGRRPPGAAGTSSPRSTMCRRRWSPAASISAMRRSIRARTREETAAWLRALQVPLGPAGHDRLAHGARALRAGRASSATIVRSCPMAVRERAGADGAVHANITNICCAASPRRWACERWSRLRNLLFALVFFVGSALATMPSCSAPR